MNEKNKSELNKCKEKRQEYYRFWKNFSNLHQNLD